MLRCLYLTRIRCILKMDHHCPWIANCVSHRTFPHFVRFLFYSIIAMIHLEYFLFERLGFIWASRHRAGVSISIKNTHQVYLCLAKVPRSVCTTASSPPYSLDCELRVFTVTCRTNDTNNELLDLQFDVHRIIPSRETRSTPRACSEARRLHHNPRRSTDQIGQT